MDGYRESMVDVSMKHAIDKIDAIYFQIVFFHDWKDEGYFQGAFVHSLSPSTHFR